MAKYERVLRDPNSGEQALIKSNDPFTFQQKADRQIERWKVANQKRRNAMAKAANADHAEELTRQATKYLGRLNNVVAGSHSTKCRLDWDDLTDKSTIAPYTPGASPQLRDFQKDVPKASFLEFFLPFIRRKREVQEAKAKYAFEKAVGAYEKAERMRLDGYEQAKLDLMGKIADHDAQVNALRASFENGETDAVIDYLNIVLGKSTYPEPIDVNHDITFEPKNKTLIVETMLPNINDFSFILSVKYLSSKEEYQNKMMAKPDCRNLYRRIIQQIAIRTLNEIYESEYVGTVHKVKFVGYVSGIDPRKGTETRIEAIKLETDRDIFMQLNLARIDPEACFDGLGGEFSKASYELMQSDAA